MTIQFFLFTLLLFMTIPQPNNSTSQPAVADKGGKMITYKTSDGKTANAYYLESPIQTGKVILMFHEWWGLNDNIKKEAESLQKKLGYVSVMALDLYDGKVATTPTDAGKYSNGIDEKRVRNIIQGAIDFAGPNVRFGTIGWCFGGTWSLQAAIMAQKQLLGCVVYYGMPETNVEKLKTLNAPVLGIYGTKDEWINEKVVNTFKSNMLEAHKTLMVKTYPADHAFANPSNPNYDKPATEDANKAVLDFLKKTMGF